MAELLLGKTEKTLIIRGIQENFRLDGRGCENYRDMELETNLISNEAGSARLRLANTDVLVGVKAEIGKPSVNRPNEGRIEFFLDCSANASPAFEGRGGEALATTITMTLGAAYDFDQCLDLKSLCLVPKEMCWILYVDILLLECGGNLFDVVSIATKAALHNTRIPNVTVGSGERGSVDLIIPDDSYDCHRLNVANVPCLITISKVFLFMLLPCYRLWQKQAEVADDKTAEIRFNSIQVGHSHIVDASMEEETCALASLVLGVRDDGVMTALKKFGSMSLDPASIVEMTEMAKRIGQSVHKALKKILEEEERVNEFLSVDGRREQQLTGFLRY